MDMKICKTSFAQDFSHNQIFHENLRCSLLSTFLNLRKVCWNLHLLLNQYCYDNFTILIFYFLSSLYETTYNWFLSHSKIWKIAAEILEKKNFTVYFTNAIVFVNKKVFHVLFQMKKKWYKNNKFSKKNLGKKEKSLS